MAATLGGGPGGGDAGGAAGRHAGLAGRLGPTPSGSTAASTCPCGETPGMSLAEARASAGRPESALPTLWVALLPIALPVALIAAKTMSGRFLDGNGRAASILSLVGDPGFALLAAAVAALVVLGRQRGVGPGGFEGERRRGGRGGRGDRADHRGRRGVRQDAGRRRAGRRAGGGRQFARFAAAGHRVPAGEPVQNRAGVRHGRDDHRLRDRRAAAARRVPAVPPRVAGRGDRVRHAGGHLDERQRGSGCSAP